jgi:hypothetical protein
MLRAFALLDQVSVTVVAVMIVWMAVPPIPVSLLIAMI